MAEEKRKEAKAAPKAAKPKEKQTKPYVQKKSCPKCGAGVHLAEHSNRRSCGKCGYFERK